MKRHVLPLVLAALIVAPAPPAAGAEPRDQDRARDNRPRNLPLPQIEAMVLPRMAGARYIGPEMIDDAHYRLKFMRGTSVIWVDVDARTGAILRRTGD